MAAKYIEDGLQDTGAVNIVTGMILDYRAFDTFGESNVLFIATCTVLILLRNDKKKEKTVQRRKNAGTVIMNRRMMLSSRPLPKYWCRLFLFLEFM